MEVNGNPILQIIFFDIPQKKVSHTGLRVRKKDNFHSCPFKCIFILIIVGRTCNVSYQQFKALYKITTYTTKQLQ